MYLALAVGDRFHLASLCGNGILIIPVWLDVSACKDSFEIFGLSDKSGSKCSCINLITMFPVCAVKDRSYLVCLHAMLFFCMVKSHK